MISEDINTQKKTSLIRQIIKRVDLFLQRKRSSIALSLLIFTFVLISCWDMVIVPIRSGYQGVYWSRFFGGTQNWQLSEGSAYKLPWDEVILYDMRVGETHQASHFLTKDGLSLLLEWSVRYRLKPDRLPELNRTIGPDYLNVFVIPDVLDALRQIIGRYRGDQIFTAVERTLRTDFNKEIRDADQHLPIDFQEINLLRLELPAAVSKGIESKLLAEQASLSYVFKLETEEQERKRKVIEAEGIKSFESISGVSMLKWRGLDVTSDLARSENSKIIIMGTSENSLPLLLNTDK